MLMGSPDVYLSGPIQKYITNKGGSNYSFSKWGGREILYEKSADGATHVTGLAMSKATSKQIVTVDAYVAACDVSEIKRLVPSQWRGWDLFDNIYKLVGVLVMTVQMADFASTNGGYFYSLQQMANFASSSSVDGCLL